MPSGNLTGKERYLNTNGRQVLLWLLDSSGLQTRESAKFQMRPPATLIQPGSWRNGKFWLSFQLPRILAKPMLSIHPKSFFLFSPKTHQHRNNHWKSTELWKNNKPWQNEACLNILILQTLGGHPLRAVGHEQALWTQSQRRCEVDFLVQWLDSTLLLLESQVQSWSGDPTNHAVKKVKGQGVGVWYPVRGSYSVMRHSQKKEKALEMPSRSPDLETQSSWLLWKYMPAPHLTHFLHWLKE